jgi:hypothetical protein
LNIQPFTNFGMSALISFIVLEFCLLWTNVRQEIALKEL